MSLTKFFSFVFFAALLAWVGGFFIYSGLIPREETVDYGATDAVAVLTGGNKRLLEGVILMEQQIADRMLISGVGGNATLDHLLESIGVEKSQTEAFAARIEIDRESRSTAENADAIAAWIKKHRLRHLRLVTANYHMPRALYELRQRAPYFPVVAHPVFSPSFKTHAWWRHPNSIALIFSEYNKFLAAFVMHGAMSWPSTGDEGYSESHLK